MAKYPIGSERINDDGYTMIKTAQPSKWELKHRVIYQKNIGPVASNMVVKFKDGNKRNFSQRNLQLCSRSESLDYNRGEPALRKTKFAIGTEKRINGYIRIKISRNTWKQKHRLIYEKKRGPIPKGMLVTFKDGNRNNFSISNLCLTTSSVLMKKNSKPNKATQFKAGFAAHMLPVGTERFSDVYTVVKTGLPDTWVLKHRMIYENEIGPIPAGMMVKFKDKNPQNFDSANLYLSTLAQSMKDNSWLNGPKELVSTLHAIGVLNRYINKKNNENGQPRKSKTKRHY